MARELTYKDLCEILATKCYVSEVTVERVLENFILLIASELQNNSYIKIKNLGKFTTSLRGGKDEWVTDDFGQMVKKYIEQFNYIDFEPSKNLVDVVNGNSIDYLFKKLKIKYDEPISFDEALERETKSKSDDCQLNYAIDKIINSRKERRHRRQESKNFNPNSTFADYNKTRQKPILCKNNNIIYPSINRAAIELGIPYTTLKSHIDGENADMECNGYRFAIPKQQKKKKKEEEE